MNQKLDEKKARFQCDNIPTRLGHIASNLARIRTFCNTAYKEAVASVTDETLWFIEWTAAEIEPEYAEELVNISNESCSTQVSAFKAGVIKVCIFKISFSQINIVTR